MHDLALRLKWAVLPALYALAACEPPPMENHAEPAANIAAPVAEPGPGEPVIEPGPVPAPAPKPAVPNPPPPAAEPESYSARGQEPGWALTIAKGRIDYQGNYGEKRIGVAAPKPAAIANGRRYSTPRLTVEIHYKRCNDAMSGHGYEHEVKIVADGEAYDGCGGPRRADWDM
jgi:uncharacterized membrane protein